MTTTTAVQHARAIPCLRYADAHAAIAWLVEVLGAEARHVFPGAGNSVSHAELWFGDGCVMLGSVRSDGAAVGGVGQGAVYVVTGSAAAVDALHERAVRAGAVIAIPLRDTDYGSHDFGCLDPEGNFWGFGTYGPA